MRAVCLAALLVAPAAMAQARTLAISYFDVHATDPELMVLKKGLADMLISDLSVVKGLTVVEREKLNSALDELKLAQSPFADPRAAVKLGKGLSATHMLTGSLTAFQGKLRISARVFDVQTSQVVQGKDVEGEVADFFALEKELVELLVAALSLQPDVKEKAALRKSQTESLPALQRYARGLDQLDRGDAAGARESFEAAQKADPQFKRVQAAIDGLKSALGSVEAKRESTRQEKLDRLSSEDPDLYEKVEALARGDDLPYGDRHLAELQVLEHLAQKGLKPWKKQHPRPRIGESTRRHFEGEKLLQLLGAFGDAPQAIRGTPVVFEYLARKYADDPTLLDRMRRDVERVRGRLEKVDFKSPVPPYQGRGDHIDRQRIHHEFITRLAASAPLPKGLTRDPLAALARVEELLAKEKARRRQEFESEFSRRYAALNAKDPKLDDELHALAVALNEEEDRLDSARKRVKLLRWLVDHPDARPHSGSKERPHYTEVSDLLQLMTRYGKDPSQWDVIPGAGEYLLKKYPDSTFLPSQLKLHLANIEERRREKPEAQKRSWAEELARSEELEAGAEVRALFQRAAEVGRKWK